MGAPGDGTPKCGGCLPASVVHRVVGTSARLSSLHVSSVLQCGLGSSSSAAWWHDTVVARCVLKESFLHGATVKSIVLDRSNLRAKISASQPWRCSKVSAFLDCRNFHRVCVHGFDTQGPSMCNRGPNSDVAYVREVEYVWRT